MAEQNPPIWMQSGTYNAVDDRLVTGMLSDRDRGSSGNGTGILGGVVPGFSQLAVTASGSNMSISIATGTVIIPSRGVSPPGAYICHNDGAKTLTLPIESSGNPRIDVIYAEVSDQTTGGAESQWTIGVQKGSPSASPVTPSLLAGRFPLAAVRVVPASQNGGVNKITSTQVKDLRRFNTSLGGVHLTKNGLPNPPAAPGRLLYNTDAKYLYISHGGSSWDYFLTYQDWMKIFASMRPRHAVGSTGVTIKPGDAYDKKWYAAPWKMTTTGNISPVQVTNMQSPSGKFKVTISAYGRTDNVGGSGHLSARVLQGSTTKLAPSTNYRSISFYSKAWEHHGSSYLLSGLPSNTNLTFRLEFYRSGTVTNGVDFNYYYLMVEPVL